jgi:hypothetical protein
VFRDERGRELFDVPDGPRPAPDVPAPARFLPEYDNVLLSHADRSRFVPPGDAKWGEGRIDGTVLHDGILLGTYRVERTDGAATLVVDHPRRLAKSAVGDVEREGRRYLELVAGDADRCEVDVRQLA